MKPSVLLTLYRVMAYVTAVLLILLCLAMVFKYGHYFLSAWPEGSPQQVFGETWTMRIGIAHGYLYLVYLVVALLITIRLQVAKPNMLLVLLAGTIPFGAFFAERKVSGWYQAKFGRAAISEDEQSRNADQETRSARS